MPEVGFRVDPENKGITLKQKTEQIKAFLDSELATSEEIRTELFLEIKEIEDIHHNIQIIENELANLKKAENHFDYVYLELRKETGKSVIDTKKCAKLIELTDDLVNAMEVTISTVSAEAQRFVNKDTHYLYKKHAANKKIIAILDGHSTRSNQICAELELIHKKIDTIPPELQLIAGQVKKVMAENQLRKGRVTVKGPGQK